MKIKNEKQQFCLTGSGIDACSEYLKTILKTIGTERQNRIRIRLTIEEMLLRYRDRFGEGTAFQAGLITHFGNTFIQIELENAVYNPLNQTENELDEWSSSSLTSLGISPQFDYSGGRNILRISVATRKMNPVIRLLIFLAVGIIGGTLLRILIPVVSTDNMNITVFNIVFEPVYYLWMRVLNLISGPVIFLMVVTTVLGFGRLQGRGANSKRLVGRYFLITLVIAIAVTAIISVITGMAVKSQEWNQAVVSSFLDVLFQIVPSEILSPFMEANTPQLILLGFTFGAILILLRERVPTLIRITKELNTVGLLIAERISWLVPIFTCIFLIIEIEGGQINMFLMLWKPLLLSILITAAVLGVMLVYTALKKHVKISILIQKMVKPFLLTLKKGSLNDVYGQTELSCTKLLGMDKEFTEISLSHGLVLYMPASILGAITLTIFSADYYHISVSWVWYLSAILLVVILMEAAPPVPGVSLLVYIAVFDMLGIPDEVLIPAMVFDIVFSILANAANQMMLQMEMIHQADRFGLINQKILRKPVDH